MMQFDHGGRAECQNAITEASKICAGQGASAVRLVQQAHEFGADGFESPAVCVALFLQQFRQFRRDFHVRLGVLLDFQIHHFLDQANDMLCIHSGLTAGLLATTVLRLQPARNGNSSFRLPRPGSHGIFAPMQTLGEIAKALNRPAVQLSGLQARFELPVLEGQGYSAAYFNFFQKILYLRALNVSEESLRELAEIERKLLQLLHADTTGSRTWFLDECGNKSHPRRRLLLSNYDLGVEIHGAGLQLGLNFSEARPELFKSAEMGEDVLRVLQDYLKLYHRIRSDLAREHQQLRDALKWASDLPEA